MTITSTAHGPMAVVVQYRLLHYRLELFERLRVACAARGIRLEVVAGQASESERRRADEGMLPWVRKVTNRFWRVGDRDLVWQPLPRDLRKAASLVIVMQESRLLSNYPLLLKRALGNRRRIAYWGHGRNFQSERPDGWREKWKRLMLTRVDWWFAYTQSSVDLVRAAGFPADRITCLDNAIDSDGFRRALAAVSEADLAAARQALGIAAGAPVALFCGSMYPDKRLDLLIDAADRIRAVHPTFVLLAVGDGPSMVEMRAAAVTRPWLHLPGMLRDAQKALYFRLADVMLNPGLVGLHIVDAFCAGLVMITTHTARHSPEVAYLRHGENGLYAPDDANGYGTAAAALLADRTRLGAMRSTALADASRYTLEAMVDHFAEGIAQAIAMRPERGR